MYEEFFELNAKPFELVPNPDFLFLSKSHRKSMTYLDYGIKERAGFILLTGEVGSGKTTIMRNLIKKLDRNVALSKVFNTMVSSEQLISMINEDFGLSVVGKDKVTLLRELNDFLIECYSRKCQAILIIDEAQNLTPELLEEVRMLSNLETDRSKLIQIILAGQPELWKTLSLPNLRQLRQRISICCNIMPLTRQETEEYILYRLEMAGNRYAVTFTEGTLDAVYRFSRGIPRLTNIICDFIMLTAFVDETKTITLDLVKEVITELERENRFWRDEDASHEMRVNKLIPEDFIGDFITRLDRIEGAVTRNQITEQEREAIFGRLSTLERVIKQLCQFFIERRKKEV
ncbi:MAG: AAA family ATPase [Deltaproteobacteria bacterium]|nr:AAA family ATPase [Deltaproteobacteria bacterium]